MQILLLVPDLVNVFAQVVASPVETPEVKAQIGRAFYHLISIYGQQKHRLLQIALNLYTCFLFILTVVRLRVSIGLKISPFPSQN
ncbi:hypothetical protein DVH24_033210 [Malus domestica]|uniref:Uncharacterized protein n=1 Tax=Malus domestica TaxID=3750 RepID=A0A498JE35_MALDO|nr:hypothetical protein DVH24_033210 [Malus domestica]